MKQAGREFILFLDEIHTMVGAGSAEGGMDASNLLKPALARGELQCIGATTNDEYRKHIEKDEALEAPVPADLSGGTQRRGHSADSQGAAAQIRSPSRCEN